MSQVAVGSSDDWVRTSHSAARRRRQNRLNQRTYRLKRKSQRTEQGDVSQELSNSPYGVLVPSFYPSDTTAATADQSASVTLQLPNFVVLTQLNIWQGILINSFILRISHFFIDDRDNKINEKDKTKEDPAYTRHYLSPSTNSTFLTSQINVPSSLTPTLLQQTVPHFPWVDLIPLATMRDNIIRAGPKLNVSEFCMDMLGTMFGTVDINTSSGLLVWGDSWLIQSWEMTEGFVKKWGWLVEGCEELVRATNRWRDMRGENELLVHL